MDVGVFDFRSKGGVRAVFGDVSVLAAFVWTSAFSIPVQGGCTGYVWEIYVLATFSLETVFLKSDVRCFGFIWRRWGFIV